MKNNKNIIDEMNPFIKILVLILVTVIVSIDYFPFLSCSLVVIMLIISRLFSTIKTKELINSIKAFITMSIGFMVIIIFARFISGEDLKILSVVGLGMKILTISLHSSIFVKTTDPTEFVISLIKYFKMSDKYAYAFLTAYRFLPTFKEEFQTIRYAHMVRGVVESKFFLVRIWNMKQYILPMLATAVRRGVRISMAMETRAFGKYNKRTYYRKLSIKKNEVIAAASFSAIVLGLTYFLYIINLTNFGLTR